MDRRIEKTERIFTEALFHFLKRKELKKITVKELCEYANMNRGTFYLHYYDIYDLMDKTEQRMIDLIFHDMPTNDLLPLQADILNTFEYIRAHKEEYRILFGSDSGLKFVAKLTDTIRRIALQKRNELFPAAKNEAADNASMFYIGGMIALLKVWVVENDCKIPPAELMDTTGDMFDYLYLEKKRNFSETPAT